jgi:hypothetical protein
VLNTLAEKRDGREKTRRQYMTLAQRSKADQQPRPRRPRSEHRRVDQEKCNPLARPREKSKHTHQGEAKPTKPDLREENTRSHATTRKLVAARDSNNTAQSRSKQTIFFIEVQNRITTDSQRLSSSLSYLIIEIKIYSYLTSNLVNIK